MKVEFLNEELTQARVTRGWFRKRQAHVVFAEKVRHYEGCDGYGGGMADDWAFASTGRYVGWWTSSSVDDAKKSVLRQRERDARVGREWVPVRKLPEARLLKDGK